MRVLLQCTIPYSADDWHVGRFSLLADELRKAGDVVARNLEPDATGDDPVLSRLGRADYDEVWLLGVDGGRALSLSDVAGINAFMRAGGGVLTTRDHQDMGMWLRQLDDVGMAHFFHATQYGEPDPSRLCRDDVENEAISWPNYHSGRNGDFQRIEPVEPLHPLLVRPGGARIELFPAHPHEGAVGVPAHQGRARAVARGKSTVTGRVFTLIVAFDRAPGSAGRAIAESSFHHFADYNWDLSRGAPTFVAEAPGDGMRKEARVHDDIRTYVVNAARWLATSAS